MSNYEVAIHRAIENAPAIYLDQPQPPVTGNADFADHFAGTTDYTHVSWNMGESAASVGNTIIVPTVDELAIVQQQIASTIGFTDHAFLEEALDHEGAHAAAGQILHAGRIALGVNLWKIYPTQTSQEHDITWQPFTKAIDFETTKLGLAAFFAHPIDPSEDDIRDLAAMGYDVDEVGYKASEHNRTHDAKIPVPRSYKPSTKIYIPLYDHE